jgi:hypothetical protein
VLHSGWLENIGLGSKTSQGRHGRLENIGLGSKTCQGRHGSSPRRNFNDERKQFLYDRHLDRLWDVGGHRLALAEVEHQNRSETDGQVLRVHFVPGRLGRHAGQVVHGGQQTVLKNGASFVQWGEISYQFLLPGGSMVPGYVLKRLFTAK